MAAPSKFHCKLVLLGDMSVGKTSLVWRFVRGSFDPDIKETVGAAFSTKVVKTDKTEVTFEIWDTAGHEKYQSIAPFYYRDASAAIVMYDITDARSLDRAKEWVKRLKNETSEKLLIVFVGNKCDLADSRAVDTASVAKYCKTQDLTFFETSAKNGTNVKEIFIEIAELLPNAYSDDDPDSIPDIDPDDDHHKKCC